MKKTYTLYGPISIFLFGIFILLNNTAIAQTDTAKPVQADTTKTVQADTTKPTVAAPATKKHSKKSNRFIVYGGVNVNQMDVTTSNYTSNNAVGYHLGAAYKQGKFFYWQAGARYNNANFDFVSKTTNTDTSRLAVRALDIPLTVGINLLSVTDRLVGLRVFVSAVPSFTLGVGDNNLNVTKSDVNSFMFYGQAGVGVDVAFVLVETGFNYGFQDLIKNRSGSNPGQFFINLGFRF